VSDNYYNFCINSKEKQEASSSLSSNILKKKNKRRRVKYCGIMSIISHTLSSTALTGRVALGMLVILEMETSGEEGKDPCCKYPLGFRIENSYPGSEWCLPCPEEADIGGNPWRSRV
jgi:hypothetical protein